jgi:hypothetical protein
MGGDFQSLQKVTGYASTALGLSRELYGSGTEYVTDFNAILNRLDTLSGINTETLTAAVYREEQRTQTETLQGELVKLREEVVALRREVAQGSAMPTRVNV